jgi:hypothetical protein
LKPASFREAFGVGLVVVIIVGAQLSRRDRGGKQLLPGYELSFPTLAF